MMRKGVQWEVFEDSQQPGPVRRGPVGKAGLLAGAENADAKSVHAGKGGSLQASGRSKSFGPKVSRCSHEGAKYF